MNYSSVSPLPPAPLTSIRGSDRSRVRSTSGHNRCWKQGGKRARYSGIKAGVSEFLLYFRPPYIAWPGNCLAIFPRRRVRLWLAEPQEPQDDIHEWAFLGLAKWLREINQELTIFALPIIIYGSLRKTINNGKCGYEFFRAADKIFFCSFLNYIIADVRAKFYAEICHPRERLIRHIVNSWRAIVPRPSSILANQTYFRWSRGSQPRLTLPLAPRGTISYPFAFGFLPSYNPIGTPKCQTNKFPRDALSIDVL